MTLPFFIVCEAHADFRICSGLADKVLCERVAWIDPETLDAFRCWQGPDDVRPFLTWTDADRRAAEFGPFGARAMGHFGGRPGAPYAAKARRTLLLLQLLKLPIEAVFLVIDSDGDLSRREGLEQARSESPLSCPVILGVAHSMRECWLLAGFEPQNDEEQESLAARRDELHFDPRLESHLLDATHDHQTRSPKRVLRLLTGGNHEPEANCWNAVSLELLSTRGQQIGLSAFLEEIERFLVPLFDPTPHE